MPSADDLANFQRLRTTGADINAQLTPKFPPLPDEVKARFPSLKAWEERVKEWETKTTIAIRGGPV